MTLEVLDYCEMQVSDKTTATLALGGFQKAQLTTTFVFYHFAR